MNTTTIATGLARFMLGGLLVSVAAQIDDAETPRHPADVTGSWTRPRH